MKYVFKGSTPAYVPDLLRDVQPGEVFETDLTVNNPYFEPASDSQPSKPVPAPAPAPAAVPAAEVVQ